MRLRAGCPVTVSFVVSTVSPNDGCFDCDLKADTPIMTQNSKKKSLHDRLTESPGNVPKNEESLYTYQTAPHQTRIVERSSLHCVILRLIL